MRHALWFSAQTAELSHHVLAAMGFEPSESGIKSLVKALKRQLKASQDRGVAIALLDLLYVVSLNKETAPSELRTVARLFRDFLCTIHSMSGHKDPLGLPPDVPRVTPIPGVPRPPKLANHWPLQYALRCLFSLLVPRDALALVGEISEAICLFNPERRGWGKSGLEEHPVYATMSEHTIPAFFAEITFAVTVQIAFDPERMTAEPEWARITHCLGLFRRLLGLHSLLAQVLERPMFLAYALRAITWALSWLTGRLC
jgi:hypothetical protein